MKNLHVLPTDKPSRLVKIYNDVNRETFTLKLDVEVNDSFKEYVNIYITSDEEIKKGDWVLNPIYKTVYKWIKNSDIYFDRIDAKKIILTTDQDLIKDGVQDIDNEFLEWFVKNPSCEYVKVEKEHHTEVEEVSYEGDFQNVDYIKYKVIIPKEESKQELSLKINDEFLDTTSKEILYTLMEEFDNLVTENSSEETLEEAAEKFYPPKTTDLICSPKLVRDSFIAGAKWQQEDIIEKLEMHILVNEDDWNRNPQAEFRNFIEQFKK